MIVWCRLCKTNTVDVHPDDALHESFEGEACNNCEALLDKVYSSVSQWEKIKYLGSYESLEFFGPLPPIT